MSFLSDLSLFLRQEHVLNFIGYFCLVFLGLAFGSFVRILLPLKKNASARFVSICIFISISIILYTILIFLTKELIPFFHFLESHEKAGFIKDSYLILLTAIFVFFTLLSLFWKVMIGVSLVLSSLFVYGNYYILSSLYGPQKSSLDFRVEEDKISLDGRDFSNKAGDKMSILVDFNVIPDTIPLPLKRSYYTIRKISERNPSSGEIESESLISDKCKNSDFFNKPLIIFYINNVILKNKVEAFSVSVPQGQFYPILYTINVSFVNGEPVFEFVRDL